MLWEVKIYAHKDDADEDFIHRGFVNADTVEEAVEVASQEMEDNLRADMDVRARSGGTIPKGKVAWINRLPRFPPTHT